MDPVYTAGLTAHPELETLDWPAQRLVAAGALRAAVLLQVAPVHPAAAMMLTDPRPLEPEVLAALDSWARDERDPLQRDLAGRAWPILAASAVVRSRQRDLGKKLAKIDQRLADRLYAAAVTTMREALKRAGIKAKVRARNRAKEAKEQLDADGMTDAVLAAINVRADELLDRSFEAYGEDAREWMLAAFAARRRAIARSWDLDPDELDDPDEANRAAQAGAILVALLLGRARSALSGVSPAREPTVQVPFALVRTAMRVRDGATVVPGPKGLTTLPPKRSPVEVLTKQAAERATPLPDLEALARGEAIPVDLEGVVPTLVQHFEWIHGYFGEPAKPFEPHVLLDGVTYTDETRGDVLAKDPSEFPEGRYEWSVDDHDSCFPEGTLVSGPLARGATLRWFEGELVEVVFASEQLLSATPNHPVLTRRGWVPIGGLREGDDVIRCVDAERVTALIPDDYQVPALIEEVIAACRVAPGMVSGPVPVAPEAFHGDGAGSTEVLVWHPSNGYIADGPFGRSREGEDPPGSSESRDQVTPPQRAQADGKVDTSPGLAPTPGPNQSVPNQRRTNGHASGASSLGAPSYGTGTSAVESLSLALAALLDVSVPHDSGARDGALEMRPGVGGSLLARPQSQREITTATAGLVEFDQVSEVHRVSFAGHVHNLQTVPHWYTANGVVVHNCTCYEVVTWEPV